MNQPDRYDRFVVPQGTDKVAYIPDTKIAHSATVEIQREDHTVGNIIRMQLHEDKQVWFAAYKVPHPLEHRMQIKVRTNGKVTPAVAYNRCLDDLHSEFKSISVMFKEAVVTALKDEADLEPHKRLEMLNDDHMDMNDNGHGGMVDEEYGVQYDHGGHSQGGHDGYGAAGDMDIDYGSGGGGYGDNGGYGAAM